MTTVIVWIQVMNLALRLVLMDGLFALISTCCRYLVHIYWRCIWELHTGS